MVTPPRATPEAGSGEPTLLRAVRKAERRLLPFLLALYVVAFLDRVNIGYVKASYLRDTGLGEGAFALGAGIFFLGYGLLEIPSNLMLVKVGARAWIGRILITWGVTAAAMTMAWSSGRFYGLRVLLGAMEAGFFPGIIFYLSGWFPERRRGAMLGFFYFGPPLAQILGGPLSGLLMKLGGHGGLRDWQWVFFVEGLLAVLAGVWTLRTLTDRPAEALWLSADERSELQGAMDAEARKKPGHGIRGAIDVLGSVRIWQLGAIYALIQVSVYGVTFYLPSQVAGLLRRDDGLLVGTVSAIPWLCALAAAYALPRMAVGPHRKRAVAALSLAAAAGAIAIAPGAGPAGGLAALCVAAAGFIGVQPIFWTVPMAELGGARAACGIALINSAGSIGGFLAPGLRIAAERRWGPSAGSTALALVTLAGAVLIGFAFSPRQGAPS